MLFHSYTFAVFFVTVAALHALTPVAGRRYVLLVSSYVFYASWNPTYAFLILTSTVIDYLAAGAIHRAQEPQRRRRFLTLSLATNLGLLGIFKYYNFLSASLTEMLSLRLPLHELLLPVGISFYTFQSMSYTIDVYRGRCEPARDFVDLALFVSFFPQLVAGPIVRAVDFLPQLVAASRRTPEHIRAGLKLFLLGLFKKIVIADNLSLLVDRVHQAPGDFSGGDLWISAYAFAFQIYFDFSGYSDMAIGLAKLLGFQFPDNFRRPYCAVNMSDFWRRWHISLSTWLRDYLYISLGGNRGGTSRTLRNLMLTMALGGLWHGANWTFIAWGVLHGLFLIVHRLFRGLAEGHHAVRRLAASRSMIPIWVLLTFHGWVISMVLFRAASIDVAGDMLVRMFWLGGDFTITATSTLLLCAVLYAAHVAEELYSLFDRFDRWPLALRVVILAATVWAMILFTPDSVEPFLYFQF
ncbi:MAG: MBOAT family O-acyltransferase [Acidobacteriota bacterium]